MKPTVYLVAATVAMVFVAPASAQVDCANWNTEAFFKAATASDVISCLLVGADLEVRDGQRRTPLRLAAEAGNVEAITTLANAGADPNTRSSHGGDTPLSVLASNGTAETIRALLQAGADPNAQIAQGQMPPYSILDIYAALNKDAGTVKALIEAGADPNAREPNSGQTPLHKAARRGTAGIIASLLEAGADPNLLDRNRKTPWDLARDREDLKKSAVYWRLEGATSAHQQLDCAGWNTEAFFVAAEASEVARCVESGADLNARSKGGWMPLHTAAADSQPAVIKTLLRAGADPNALSRHGRAPLHMALAYDKFKAKDHNRDYEVAAALLEAGADPNEGSSGGGTPLHAAAGSGQLSAIRALLKAGAVVEVRTEYGHTPLDYAANEAVRALLVAGTDHATKEKSRTIMVIRDPAQVDCANWNTAAFFKAATKLDVTRCLEAGADPNVRDRNYHLYAPLHFVATVGYAGAVEALANRGADIGARAGNGETTLHIAALVENVGVVEALAKHGADLEARSRDGYTPLHRAAGRGFAKVVQALLEAGADPNARDENGRTSLHAVVDTGNAEAVAALLEAGADPNARDKRGRTPLHEAAISGDAEAVAALILAGADPNLRAGNGKTPLHYENNEAVRALLEWGGAVQTTTLSACANWNTRAFIAAAKPSDVTRCLQMGMYLEIRDGGGETLLYKAVMIGTAEVVNTLLEAGANPNVRDMICKTPLHWAASSWRSEVGMALLAEGADPTVRDADGNFPFDVVPSGIGDILRLQAEGFVFPSRGNRSGREIGGPLQTSFYSKLYQGKFSQVRRLFSPNPIPPACSESGDPLSAPSVPRRRPYRVR